MKNICSLALLLLGTAAGMIRAETPRIEEIVVNGSRFLRDTSRISPVSVISAEQAGAVNFMTSEDIVAYEPNLVVRRRFVGDPNGTLGIRGANMFQTTRSMVYADGLPLHYFLQTSYAGSPRWSLVGADEIASAEVIYGPFSAEYSGNAMGGVVNIMTRDPQHRRVVMEGTLLAQDHRSPHGEQLYTGGKLFASYEDRIGQFSVYGLYSHLENQGQPQTRFFAPALTESAAPGTDVRGGRLGQDVEGNAGLYYGDSGVERSTSDLYKLKLGYDLGLWQWRSTIAYEVRDDAQAAGNNYLTNEQGKSFWQGIARVAGQSYTIGAANFEQRRRQRESLLLGSGLSGPLGNNWVFDVYATDFRVLRDEEVRSARHPFDPAFQAENADFAGRLSTFDDTGWQTLDIKFSNEYLFDLDNLRLSLGYHQDSYHLGIEQFQYDYARGLTGQARGHSQGTTGTRAVFLQGGWRFHPDWDLTLGVRQEWWQTRDGETDDLALASRDLQRSSPKLSLAWFGADRFTLRYSFARAYRFPVTEELYQNMQGMTSISVANAGLRPEAGLHHNLSLHMPLDQGSLQVNVFRDEVNDVIFNQLGSFTQADTHSLVSVRTFLPIDEVRTQGIELAYDHAGLFRLPVDLRFNLSYTNATIVRNDLNPALEGKNFPRMPHWRANLLVNYRMTDTLQIGAGLRYASNSFDRLDNSDIHNEVFGAQDAYLFANMKANWQVKKGFSLALGVDNLFNELAYVYHPWPSRTVFLEGRYQL